MGQGTYFDIPPHLKAAIKILTQRLLRAPPKISRPFDRLAVESVLYQVFLVSTGLWSDQSPLLDFDLGFWAKAEKLLEESVMFAGESKSLNSPVLGVPVALFRLAIQAKDMYQTSQAFNVQALSNLRSEVEAWEAIVLCDKEIDRLGVNGPSNPYQSYYDSASYLYALIVSLLLEQTSACLSIHESGIDQRPSFEQRRPPSIAATDSWQVQKAMQIIKKHKDDRIWTGCYMGNWPVYTLGFFLSEPEHIELVRQDLKQRWEITKFMQVPRFWDDLESVWAARTTLSHPQLMPTYSISPE